MLCCPQCGSRLLYKDGLRCLADGSSIQRYLCRNCGYRFSETGKSNIALHTKSESDAHQKAAKLLVEAEKAIEKRKREPQKHALTLKEKS
jgi:transposase-like protein